MPVEDIPLAHERARRFYAQQDLQQLNILTWKDWMGEMPEQPAKTPEELARRRAHAEGSQMRKEFRDRLIRTAFGQPVAGVDDVGQFTTNQYGELVDGKGRIHARDADHIKEIIWRFAKMRV